MCHVKLLVEMSMMQNHDEMASTHCSSIDDESLLLVVVSTLLSVLASAESVTSSRRLVSDSVAEFEIWRERISVVAF